MGFSYPDLVKSRITHPLWIDMAQLPPNAPHWLEQEGTSSGTLTTEEHTILAWDHNRQTLTINRDNLTYTRAFSLEKEPLTLHISRSREEPERGFIQRLLRVQGERDWLHVELRSQRERIGIKAAAPSQHADTLLAGLPWMARVGERVRDFDALVGFSAAWVHQAPDSCDLAHWDPADVQAPSERDEPTLLEPAPIQIDARPAYSAWKVFKLDWTASRFFALIFPLILAAPLMVIAAFFYAEEARFQEERVTVTGTVTNKETETSDSTTYRVYYTFTTQDGALHDGDDTTTAGHWNTIRRDDTINIDYQASDPINNRLAGEDQFYTVWIAVGLGIIPLTIAGILWFASIRRARSSARLYQHGVKVTGTVTGVHTTNYKINNRRWLYITFTYPIERGPIMEHPSTLEGKTPGVNPDKLRFIQNGGIVIFYDPDDPKKHTWERPLTR